MRLKRRNSKDVHLEVLLTLQAGTASSLILLILVAVVEMSEGYTRKGGKGYRFEVKNEAGKIPYPKRFFVVKTKCRKGDAGKGSVETFFEVRNSDK